MEPAILTVAFGMGYLMYRLGLPPLVGFLLAGLLLSAFGITSTSLLKTGSEVGVTLLLFTIGLKLKVKNLLRPEVWAGASIHMGLSVALFGFALFGLSFSGLKYFTGIDLKTTLLLAFALSFSSTVFAVKILDESSRMDSLNGRTAIGVLIIQDIAAVIYLTISTGKMPSVWALVVIGALPVARVAFLSLLNRVGHGELMVLLGLFVALIAGAYTFQTVQIKPDLGALILGMLMAPHPRAKELANALLSIKDILLVGFFLDIGLTGLPNAAGLAAAGAFVLLLPLKMILYYLVFTRFTFKARTAFITTMNLSNYSEFGLIVSALAVSTGYIDPSWLVVIAIALSFSFMIASPLNKYANQIFERFRAYLKRIETDRRHPDEIPIEAGTWNIAVIGMGRVGEGAYDWFQQHLGHVVMGFDFDRETITRHIEAGRQVGCADVTDPDFWRRLPVHDKTIQLVVLALSNIDAMLYTMKMLQQRGYSGQVAAVARYDDHVEALLASGVDTAFNIYDEAGAGLAAHVCENLGLFCGVNQEKNVTTR